MKRTIYVSSTIAMLLWLVFTFHAWGQSGVIVSGAGAQFDTSIAVEAGLSNEFSNVQAHVSYESAQTSSSETLSALPITLQSLMGQVTSRIIVGYTGAMSSAKLVSVPTGFSTVLQSVTPRIVSHYVGVHRVLPLQFPKELVNDKTPPKLLEKVSPQRLSNNEVRVVWRVDEYVNSTVKYGTTSGVYGQSIDLPSIEKTGQQKISGLTPNVTYFGRVVLVDLSGNQTTSDEFTFSVTPPNDKPLVLIYAVLDNDLGAKIEDWQRLVQNVELGAQAGIYLRLFIDSPGDSNAYIYEIKPNQAPCITLANPTCSGRYVEGTNFWKVNEDSAHPMSIYEFVRDAIQAHNQAQKIILSLVGHGSGWSASAIPSQPSGWNQQPSRGNEYSEKVGGLLWDDTIEIADNSRSLSSKALGVALKWIGDETGRRIDLLYLDACSMGMAEVGDEIVNNVDYLLASPNSKWASFAYDNMLKAITAGQSSEAIGKAWLNAEKAALDGRGDDHPYTLALYNLSQMGQLATAVQGLSGPLQTAINSNRNAVLAAFAATERYESIYDGNIQTSDNYGDLGSLLGQLKAKVPADSALNNAVTTVETALATVIVSPFAVRSGVPHLYPGHEWKWINAKGMAIYLSGTGDEKRTLYTAENLKWVAATQWGDVLNMLWGNVIVQSADITALPTCSQTTNCSQLPQQLEVKIGSVVYLPLLRR